MKSFLIYLNILKEDELSDVDVNKEVLKVLEEL